MRRFLVCCQFNGKNYNGFQKNENGKTIQGEIENALEKLFLNKIEITGCSRTDAGVSAEKYFFHFDAETKLPADRVCFKLNRFLPKDIQCFESQEVKDSFSARDCKKKTYQYSIYQSPHLLPLLNRDCVQVKENLNVNDMQEASKFLIGKHDFASFRSENADVKSSTRTIFSINIKKSENVISFEISADGFLYNMVRILVGTLIDVGTGKIKVAEMSKILESKNRQQAGQTMPAKALRLVNVEY